MPVITNRICCFLILLGTVIWQIQAVNANDMITIPGKNFFPEGIASDGNGGIYLGSLTTRKIIHIDLKNNTASVFADKLSAPGLLSVFGLLVDRQKHLLYACSTDAGVAKLGADKVTSLFAFDLKNPGHSTRYPFPGGGFCNDMALGPDGSLYVTDTHKARILILHPEAMGLEVWLENNLFGGDGINLNGLVWSDNQLYVVKSNSGELFRVTQKQDMSPLTITKIKTPRPLQFPDGLERLSRNRLIVVEGSGNLNELLINGNDAKINIIARGLDVPTTVEIIDGKAIVVQAQLDHLFDPEKAGPPSPFSLKIIPLSRVIVAK